MSGQEMYAYWLCSAPGIGSKTVIKLLEKVGSPEEIYRQCERVADTLAAGLTQRQAESLLWQKKNVDPEKSYVNLMEKKIGFVWIGQAEYPARLRDIPDPPAALYYRGTLPEERDVFVAVVGARDCSSYGKYVAEELGKQLGSNGVTVVSGLARGIDGISQKAAMACGGSSVAVMGCGVDICYPAQNREIYHMLQRQGTILSEYVPGTAPSPALFPARNRIISGMADILVVVEARKKSGTLITVDMALEQGKDVYVVPGRVTDLLSEGCNELLRQGAGVITSVEAFAEHICGTAGTASQTPVNDIREAGAAKKESSVRLFTAGYTDGSNASGKSEEPLLLKQRILEVLDADPKTADEIYEIVSKEVPVSLQEVLCVLLELHMEGHAGQIGGSYVLTYR